MRVGQAEVEAGVLPGEDGGGLRDQRAHDRVEAGQPDPSGVQPGQGGQFRRRRVDPADDLGCPVGQQAAGRGEPDPAADPLDQLGTELRLQPGQLMADRRLGVLQLLGGRGDRPLPPHGVDHAKLNQSHHT